MGEVDALAAGVQHELETGAEIGDHEVVDDAAFLVGQQRVTLAAGFEAGDVAGDEFFEGGGVG